MEIEGKRLQSRTFRKMFFRHNSIVIIHLETSVFFNPSLFRRHIHSDLAELFIIHWRFLLLIGESISQPVFIKGGGGWGGCQLL